MKQFLISCLKSCIFKLLALSNDNKISKTKPRVADIYRVIQHEANMSNNTHSLLGRQLRFLFFKFCVSTLTEFRSGVAITSCGYLASA